MLRRSLVLVAVACGGARVAAAVAGSRAAAAFPVTIKAANGDVTIKAPDANRLALADSDRGPLRGRRRQAGHRGRRPVRLPEAGAATKLSGFTPNAEAIAAYNPDLVVVSNDGGLVAALQKLGITVLLEPAADERSPRRTTRSASSAQATGQAPRRRRSCGAMQKQADLADPQRAEAARAT